MGLSDSHGLRVAEDVGAYRMQDTKKEGAKLSWLLVSNLLMSNLLTGNIARLLGDYWRLVGLVCRPDWVGGLGQLVGVGWSLGHCLIVRGLTEALAGRRRYCQPSGDSLPLFLRLVALGGGVSVADGEQKTPPC